MSKISKVLPLVFMLGFLIVGMFSAAYIFETQNAGSYDAKQVGAENFTVANPPTVIQVNDSVNGVFPDSENIYVLDNKNNQVPLLRPHEYEVVDYDSGEFEIKSLPADASGDTVYVTYDAKSAQEMTEVSEVGVSLAGEMSTYVFAAGFVAILGIMGLFAAAIAKEAGMFR